MDNPREKILIDTRVLLDDPDVIARVRRRNGMAFLSAAVLDELALMKQGEAAINKNAGVIFRALSAARSTRLQLLPGGEALRGGDTLTQLEFRGDPVFLLARQNSRAAPALIELARDYGIILLTRDRDLKARAASLGVKVAIWTGPQRAPEGRHGGLRGSGSLAAADEPASHNIPPFALSSAPIAEPDGPVVVHRLPSSGETVRTPAGRRILLGARVNAGGEGVIFETPAPAEVCKIYHRDKLTRHRRRKIELMVSRKIERPGLCWPTEIVLNDAGEFVGYVMPRASGRTVQSSMFVKPVLERTFPQWKRRDLVSLCIAFLEHIRFLHDLNIIVGDINPLNLLVTEDSSRIYMVDADSFQVEHFPCPVGTVNFTAPELQGTHYGKYLRSKEHELFAVATMIFMFLHPGKPPYSQQGGGSPMDNIKAMDFPYRFVKDEESYCGKNAPQGPWQRIWSNLPYPVRETFHNTFRLNRRTSVDEWIKVLRRYGYSLEKGYTSDELFPTGFKILDPIENSCGKCGARYMESEQRLRHVQAQGLRPWCPDCVNRANLERMANQSLLETRQAESLGRKRSGFNPAAASPPPYPGAPRPGKAQPPAGSSGAFPSPGFTFTTWFK